MVVTFVINLRALKKEHQSNRVFVVVIRDIPNYGFVLVPIALS